MSSAACARAKLFHGDVGPALSKAPAVALTQQYIPPTRVIRLIEARVIRARGWLY